MIRGLVGITWKELFPWLPVLVAALNKVAVPFFYIWSFFGIIFQVGAIILIFLRREIRLFPKPGLPRYRYRWSAKTVALCGLLTAITIVFNYIGGWITVIPGIMSFGVFYYAMMYVFPIIFGWPGIWSAPLGEILGGVLKGGMHIGWFYCAWAYDFFLGWVAWKLVGGDTSLRTLKSWAKCMGVYLLYAFLQSFGWGVVYIWIGLMPLSMLMPRSGFNIVWYFFFIWLYPPLIFIFHELAVRYRLHWKLIEPQPYEVLD